MKVHCELGWFQPLLLGTRRRMGERAMLHGAALDDTPAKKPCQTSGDLFSHQPLDTAVPRDTGQTPEGSSCS